MKRLTPTLALCVTVAFGALFWGSSDNWSVQAQQPAVLVIEGGTLIDGNGGEPIADPVVIIQGNKITSVSREGQVSIPSAARIIRADGKFILPGLWEVETVYRWFDGEAEITNGVTSVADIGAGGELLGLHREAVNQGKIGGPRLFTGITRIGPSGLTGGETPLSPGQMPKSVDDARIITRRILAAGADVVNLDGGLPVDYYRAAIEEAHKAGKPAFVRPSGPQFLPDDAALADADILSHSAGIAIAVASNPSKWMRAPESEELNAYADMDDSKATKLIQLLVQHKVALQPTLIRFGRGFHKETASFLEEDREWWLSNPGLRAYYPVEMFETSLLENTPNPQLADREVKLKGYQNMLRFNREFVQAGGRLLAGGNSPYICPPGLGLHQELDIFADVGLTPTQLIQSVTKWPAEAYRALDKLGSIDIGKLADLIIVKEDPLKSIKNLRKIDTVIYNGKIQDLGYHADYRPPFRGGVGFDNNLVVDDLAWVEALKAATARGSGLDEASTATGPGGPIRVFPPAIETISPYVVTQGNARVTVDIKGFNFNEKSTVRFDGVIVPSRFVSPTEIQVTLNEDLLQVGRHDIVVKDWGVLINEQAWRARDGSSNTAHLLVDFKY